MVYMGVDPGKSGGIAALDGRGQVLVACKMPETERDLFDALRSIRDLEAVTTTEDLPPVSSRAYAMLERVNAGVWGHGKAAGRMGVVSAFTFGCGYGQLLMGLTAAGVPFDLVLPVKWQGALACRSGGDKNITKRRAQQLFPSITVTHAIADALLLAEYGRRLALGIHQQTRGDDGKEKRAGTETDGESAAPQVAEGRAAGAGRQDQRHAQGARPQRAAVPGAPGHGSDHRRQAQSALRVHRRRTRGHEPAEK